MTTHRLTTIGTWLLRLIAAVILLQTLYFKFTASEESVYIFSTLGMEPYGRIGTGVMELIASILLLYPRTTVFGALLAMGLMGGAIFFHLSKLGIEVMNDGGQLFVYAVLVFVASLALVLIYRTQIYSLLKLNAKYRV
ncbi:MAG: DoxX family protein [Ferruginibacter sp.]|nr:DoxX family protein [Ferruginibacter sp.]